MQLRHGTNNWNPEFRLLFHVHKILQATVLSKFGNPLKKCQMFGKLSGVFFLKPQTLQCHLYSKKINVWPWGFSMLIPITIRIHILFHACTKPGTGTPAWLLGRTRRPLGALHETQTYLASTLRSPEYRLLSTHSDQTSFFGLWSAYSRGYRPPGHSSIDGGGGGLIDVKIAANVGNLWRLLSAKWVPLEFLSS